MTNYPIIYLILCSIKHAKHEIPYIYIYIYIYIYPMYNKFI